MKLGGVNSTLIRYCNSTHQDARFLRKLALFTNYVVLTKVFISFCLNRRFQNVSCCDC